MKTKSLITYSAPLHPELENMIQKKDCELKEIARRNGKHFGKRNLPAAEGDTLASCTGELKTGYEQLGAEMFHHLQPQTNFPHAKMDADFTKAKEKQLDAEIKELADKNLHDEYELQNFQPGSLPLRAIVALGLSLIILSGEVFYNIKAFQLIVENMLSALWLSIGASTGVLIASHAAAFFYKMAKTKLQRWLIIIASLSLMSSVFYIIAVFRTDYLASHNVHINAIYFVIFNLFFFLVISFLSFFILPTWEEVKQQYHLLFLHKTIGKRKGVIKKLLKEKEAIQVEKHITEKERASIIYYANYQVERIRKMYAEAVGIFIGTNRIYRTDGQIPDFFLGSIPELDLGDITITFVSQNGKLQ